MLTGILNNFLNESRLFLVFFLTPLILIVGYEIIYLFFRKNISYNIKDTSVSSSVIHQNSQFKLRDLLRPQIYHSYLDFCPFFNWVYWFDFL